MNIQEYIETDEIQSIIKSIMDTEFIKEMETGELSDEKFKHYLIQDDIYLKYYKKAGNTIKTNAKNEYIKSLFEMIGSEEPIFHRDMLEMYKIKKDDINDDMMNYTTYSYVNHLIRWARESEYMGMISMFPCQWSYEYIAKNSDADDDKFKFWFDFYKSKGYTDITEKYFNILKNKELYFEERNTFKFGLLYELNYWIFCYNLL